jgi:hypothetical protein
MSLSIEMIQDILLRLDRQTLKQFCEEDDVGICDDYFWKQKAFIDYGYTSKPKDWTWYERWWSHTLIFDYEIWYEEAYISAVDTSEFIEVSDPFPLTSEEKDFLIDQFDQKLKFILQKYVINIDEDLKRVIIITTDDITDDKIDHIFEAISNDIEAFRKISQPADFDFGEYIDRFEEPLVGYTQNDLEPRRYHIFVNMH